MKGLLKSALVFLSAAIILLAGIFLPSLILERVMNSKIDDVKYIEADEIKPYDDEFFKLRKILSELRNSTGTVYGANVSEDIGIATDLSSVVITYEDAPVDYQNRYNVGLAQFLKLVNKWEPGYYDDLLPHNLTYRAIMVVQDYTLGIAEYVNDSYNRSGRVVFDTSTGLPVSFEFTIPYANHIRLDNLWKSYVKVFADEVGMDFELRSFISDDVYGYISHRQAFNRDESAILTNDTLFEDEHFIIHFYLE